VTDAALALTGDLRDELAANDRAPIDPAKVPCRYSSLKQIERSPLHYWWAAQNQHEETLSMRLGSGAHALLFGTPFVVWTGKTRNGKAWDAFELEHAGQTILSQSELRKAQAMADAIRASKVASAVLFCEGTVHEKRIDWTWQGRSFRSTPDAASRRHLADLKCLRSADPTEAMWQSRKMHYHSQAALYRRALNSIGHHIADCYLVVVENKAPHPVTVLRFTPNALDAGDRIASGWLEQVIACEASGNYPGYVQHVVDLDLPVTESDLVFGDDDDSNEED
jgi:hypothetical protein